MDTRDTKVRLASLAIALLVVAMPPVVASADSVLPPPQQLPPTGDCYDDNIFYGAIPPGGEESQVLVFVHGLSGLAEDWWSANTLAGLNDMYVLAYEAGYRTAFVNLNVNLDTPGDCSVVRRPANGVLDNAFVLSRQLETILQHYDASQVDIIAHSKGGIDSQAAIVWGDAWPYVRNVFTLGTPHQGSILIDLLWSPEGFWVAALLGQLDDATFSLRTASMALFRASTDPQTVDDAVHYYSGAGNYWQTPGSLYERTGEWLQNHPEGGDNDGVVTVASTYLTRATTLFIEPWNHYEVYLGRNSFPYIHQVLLSNGVKVYLPLIVRSEINTSGTLDPPDAGWPMPAASAIPDASQSFESNYILRGGRLNGPATERVLVEPQARAVRFSLLTTNEQVTATVSEPNGLTYRLTAVPNNSQGVFDAAFLLGRTVGQPSPGEWAIQIDSPTEAGYLLVVTLDSQLRVGLDGLPHRPILPGQTVHLTAQSNVSGSGAQVDQIRLRTIRAMPGPNRAILEELSPRTGRSLSYVFTQEDIYGLSITVTGQTTGGMPFERSFVHSLAVVRAEHLADDSTALNTLWRR